MAESVNDLPGNEGENPADQGLAGTMKDAGLVTEHRTTREEEGRRPLGVGLAAALMFGGAAWVMPFLLITENDAVPSPWLGAVVGFATLLGVVSSMAMFMLKRWSVFVYTLAVIISNVAFMVVGQWNVLHLIIPLIVLAVAYSQIKHLH